MNDAHTNLHRLRAFVMDFGAMLGTLDDERAILNAGARLLGDLVRNDDWLPDEYAAPDPARYRQYLLHCDSQERFSVVSFVWGPGQSTPVHDHRTWGLVGMLRGSETSEPWAHDGSGTFGPSGPPRALMPGDVETISVEEGDVHRVANALADRTSISIHVYGANIGQVERATYDADGRPKPFVSGYSNQHCPNFWSRT